MPKGVYIRKNKSLLKYCLDCGVSIHKRNRSGFCLSCSHKRNPTRYWLGKKRPDHPILQKGRKISEETRKRLSESHRGKSSPFKGKRRPEISFALIKKNPKTDESKIWRTRIEYRLWRESVFARDVWTCQKCKGRGGRLHPHHILNFSSHVELRFAIDNGITLCEDCHKKFHHEYGNKKNTLEQINNYIQK